MTQARTKQRPPARPEPEHAGGILTLSRSGPATLVDPTQPVGGAVQVPPRLVKQYSLVRGASVSGLVRPGRNGRELATVETVGGLAPEDYLRRTPFEQLVAVDPTDRFKLGSGGDPGMRVVDLMAPVGRGTRGLIVAPPKAGKTALLEQIARAVRTERPEARIVVLLIDERPEELTYFRRAVQAEVFASSSDQPTSEHTALCELMLDHIRVELECGQHVVVLLDSLTRLVRAFNLRGGGPSRTMSGGLDAAAVQLPRRFFGLARNVENGGSVTLLATVLIDTGSRMDQYIYEEFKSTGNSEIVLDRGLAEERIFPAIDVRRSGTRKEEFLFGPEEARGLALLRRAMAGYGPKEALQRLQRYISQFPDNDEMLRQIARAVPA